MYYAHQTTQKKWLVDHVTRFSTEDQRDAFVAKFPTIRRPIDKPEDTSGFRPNGDGSEWRPVNPGETFQ